MSYRLILSENCKKFLLTTDFVVGAQLNFTLVSTEVGAHGLGVGPWAVGP